MKVGVLFKVAAVAACITATGIGSGCTEKPTPDELSRLDTEKSAADAADKKYYELKQERLRLEAELQQKQDELKKDEEERDNVKQKVGQ